MSKWYRKEINYSPKRKSKGPNKFNPSSPKPKERQKYETHKLLTIFKFNSYFLAASKVKACLTVRVHSLTK